MKLELSVFTQDGRRSKVADYKKREIQKYFNTEDCMCIYSNYNNWKPNTNVMICYKKPTT